jgi:hypothetical protein
VRRCYLFYSRTADCVKACCGIVDTLYYSYKLYNNTRNMLHKCSVFRTSHYPLSFPSHLCNLFSRCLYLVTSTSISSRTFLYDIGNKSLTTATCTTSPHYLSKSSQVSHYITTTPPTNHLVSLVVKSSSSTYPSHLYLHPLSIHHTSIPHSQTEPTHNLFSPEKKHRL